MVMRMTKKKSKSSMSEQTREELLSKWRPVIAVPGRFIRERGQFQREKELYYIWILPEVEDLPDKIVGHGDWSPEFERFLGQTWDGYRADLLRFRYEDLVAKRTEIEKEVEKIRDQELDLFDERRIYSSQFDLADSLEKEYAPELMVRELEENILTIPPDPFFNNSEPYIVTYDELETVGQLRQRLSDRVKFTALEEQIASITELREDLSFRGSVLKMILEYDARFGAPPQWLKVRKQFGYSALPDENKLHKCLLVRLLLKKNVNGDWGRKSENGILRAGNLIKITTAIDIFSGMANLANETLALGEKEENKAKEIRKALARGKIEVTAEAIQREFARHIKPPGRRRFSFDINTYFRMAELWADQCDSAG